MMLLAKQRVEKASIQRKVNKTIDQLSKDSVSFLIIFHSVRSVRNKMRLKNGEYVFRGESETR